MEWLIANWVAVAAAVYVIINEIIALAPNLKSNSVVQLVLNLLKAIVPKPPQPPA